MITKLAQLFGLRKPLKVEDEKFDYAKHLVWGPEQHLVERLADCGVDDEDIHWILDVITTRRKVLMKAGFSKESAENALVDFGLQFGWEFLDFEGRYAAE